MDMYVNTDPMLCILLDEKISSDETLPCYFREEKDLCSQSIKYRSTYPLYFYYRVIIFAAAKRYPPS